MSGGSKWTLSLDPDNNGFPPGELGYAPPEASRCPVALPATGAELTPLLDYQSVFKVLRDSQHFSIKAGEDHGTTGNTWRSLQDFIQEDPPELTKHRRVLHPWFTGPALESRRSEVEATATRLAQQFAEVNKPADLIAGYTEPFIAELVTTSFGVSLDRWPLLNGLTNIALGLIRTSSDKAIITNAWDSIYEYMEPLVAEKRTRPDGSLLSSIIHTMSEDQFTDDEILHVCSTLFTGFPTPFLVINACAVEFLGRPELVAACLKDSSRWEPAIWEAMRYKAHFAVGRPRIAKTDVALESGTTLKAGDVVLPSFTAALHDPEAVENPDTFDPAQRAKRWMVFGSGSHLCPAIDMSVQWLEIGLRSLFSVCPDLQLTTPATELDWQTGLLSTPTAIPVSR